MNATKATEILYAAIDGRGRHAEYNTLIHMKESASAGTKSMSILEDLLTNDFSEDCGCSYLLSNIEDGMYSKSQLIALAKLALNCGALEQQTGNDGSMKNVFRGINRCNSGNVLYVYESRVTGEETYYDNTADQNLTRYKGYAMGLIDAGMMGQWYAHLEIPFEGQPKVIKLFDTLNKTTSLNDYY